MWVVILTRLQFNLRPPSSSSSHFPPASKLPSPFPLPVLSPVPDDHDLLLLLLFLFVPHPDHHQSLLCVFARPRLAHSSLRRPSIQIKPCTQTTKAILTTVRPSLLLRPSTRLHGRPASPRYCEQLHPTVAAPQSLFSTLCLTGTTTSESS